MGDKWQLKWMAWEVTPKCNMSCVHCRSSSEENSPEGIFNLDVAKTLFDSISGFANPVVVLSGGEPLLRNDLFDMADMGTSKGFRMALATNGSLVDGRVCADIKKSGIKMVSLSLDGPDKDTHDDFRRQKGAFESVIKASELFNSHGIKFIINSSFTKRNQAYIEQTYKFAKSLGAFAWYMFLIVPTGRGSEISSELVSKDDYEDILNWHYDMERVETDILVRPTCAPQYYRIWHERSKAEGLSSTRRSLSFSTGGGKGCIAGQSIALINNRGELFPCSYFPLSAGNILEKNIRDIWHESELLNSLRDFGNYEEKCGGCRYIGVCGGCRARSYAESGSYLSEEPFCGYPGG